MFRRTLLAAGLALALLVVGFWSQRQHAVQAADSRVLVERSLPTPPVETGDATTHTLVPVSAEPEPASSPEETLPLIALAPAMTFASEVRVRVYFCGEGADSMDSAQGNSPVVWRDSATPARGSLSLELADASGELGSFEASVDLDAEGLAAFSLSEAWASVLVSPEADVEATASLVVAPGLAPLPAVQLDRSSIFEVVEFSFGVEVGYVLQGEVAGADGDGQSAVAHILPGRVSPADLAEWNGDPRLRSRASRDELLSFEGSSDQAQSRAIPVHPDGSFGPFWLSRAEALWVAVTGPRGFGTWRAERPLDLDPGALWSVGPVELKAPTALELRVRASGASVPAGCRLHWQCEETSNSVLPKLAGEHANSVHDSNFEPVLRAVDPALADLIYEDKLGGPILEAGAGGLVRLAPLPPIQQIFALRVALPDGRQTSPIRVELMPGRTTQVEIDLSEHFAAVDLCGVCVDGRVLWEDGEPASGVQLSHASLGAAAQATTDEQGRFRVAGLAPDREHAFRLTGWDAKAPRRDRWRLATLASTVERPNADAECARVEWTIERPRYLAVRGLELPSGAFADAEPVEWVLQEFGTEGDWASYPLDSVEWTDRGSQRDVRVSLPSATTGVRRLRLVAVWSPLYTTASNPVELHPGGPLELQSTFEKSNERPAILVTGRVIDVQGEAVAGATVHALCTCTEGPPLAATTDHLGGFHFEGVRVDDLQFFVDFDGTEVERWIDPAKTNHVELTLR